MKKEIHLYRKQLFIMGILLGISAFRCPVKAEVMQPTSTPCATADSTLIPSLPPEATPTISPSPRPTSTPKPKPKKVAKRGKTYRVGNYYFKVLTKSKVQLKKVKNKKIKSVIIPAKVKIYGKWFWITALGNKSFYGCKKLTRIIIKNNKISAIGRGAFLNIGKRPQFQVPKKKYRKYVRLLYGKKVWNAYIYYPSMTIVSKTDTKYDYNDIQKDLSELSMYFGSLMRVSTIGVSNDQRNIYCITMGSVSASKQVVISAGIHAREWRNCHFLMEKLEYLVKHYDEKIYQGKTVAELLKGTCLYILPDVNPDGTMIAQYGPTVIRNKTLYKKLKKMPGIKNYSTWKANARGVDLNRNFDVGWGFLDNKAKKPCDSLYPGDEPASEIETRALSNFMNRLSNPQVMVSYHSTGGIIYFDYGVTGTLKTRINQIAERVHRLTGYGLVHGSVGTVANGGFGDWCAYVRKVPTVTIETGSVACPLPFSQMKGIRSRNKYVIESMLLGK